MSRVVDLHHCVANFAGRRLTVLANTTLSPHTDLHGTLKFTKLVHRCLCFEGVAGVGVEPTHRAYETQTSTESPALKTILLSKSIVPSERIELSLVG
jgi:hypothetical protein